MATRNTNIVDSVELGAGTVAKGADTVGFFNQGPNIAVVNGTDLPVGVSRNYSKAQNFGPLPAITFDAAGGNLFITENR